MSSRLLFAAMNSVRLTSLLTPVGSPSKSNLFELTYSFFSLDSLQIADWLETEKQTFCEHLVWALKLQWGITRNAWGGRLCGPYRQRGELVSTQVQRLQLSPLVDAQRQLRDLIAAQVESLQAAQGIQALRYPSQVVTGKVHIWFHERRTDEIEREPDVNRADRQCNMELLGNNIRNKIRKLEYIFFTLLFFPHLSRPGKLKTKPRLFQVMQEP